jgi:hypothetical protein
MILRYPTLALLLLGSGPAARQLVAQRADPPVTDSQRAGLVLNADSVWHHGFGFAFPHPGKAFSPNATLATRLRRQYEGHPEMAVWILTDEHPPRSVTITLTTFAMLDEAGFRRFATGVREGYARSTLKSESLVWVDTAGDFQLTMQHPSGLYLVTRCLSHRQPTGAVAVCVQTAAPDSDDMALVRSGFHFGRVAQ